MLWDTAGHFQKHVVWFLISWGSQWLSTEPSTCCCLSEPLLKQLPTGGRCWGIWAAWLWNVLLLVRSWGSGVITRHVLTHSTWRFAVWDQSQAFQHWESDSRPGFHWKFTGSLKVFSLQEFGIFQILSHRVETTEREPFTRLKLFRLCSYRGQQSLLFPLCPCCTQAHLPEEFPCYSSHCSSLFIPIFVFPIPILYWLAALFPKCRRFDEREYTGTFPVTSIFYLTYTLIWMLNGISLSAACLCSLLHYPWLSWIDRVGIFFF